MEEEKLIDELKVSSGNKLKQKLIKNAERMYYNYSLGTRYNSQWNVTRFKELAMYALGIQDQTRYRSKYDINVQNPEPFTEDVGRNLKILNQVIVTLLGNMSQQIFTPTVYRIDARANDLRNDFKNKLGLAMDLKKLNLGIQNLFDELQISMDELPIDNFDLERTIQNKQFADEANMQMALKSFFEGQNMTAVLEALRQYLIVYGVGGIRVDPMSKRIKLRAWNPLYCQSNYTRHNDLTDSYWFTEIILVPLDELEYEGSGWIENWDQVSAMATTAENFFQRFTALTTGRGSINTFFMAGYMPLLKADKVIPVLDFEYRRTERLTVSKRVCSDGRERTFVGMNKSGKDIVDETAFQYRYAGKLIIGTQEMYQWGKVTPSAREYGGERDRDLVDYFTCHSGFIGYRPAALDGQNSSPVEKAVEYIDMIQQCWVKARRIAKNILPPIIKVDMKGFENVMMKPGGGKVTGFELAKELFTDGIAIYNSESYTRNMNQNRDMPVGIENLDDVGKLRSLLDLMAANISSLREFMSVPPQMTGALPGTRTGKGVSELMINNATVSLKPYYDAVENIYIRTCKYLILMFKYLGTKGNYNGSPYEINSDDVWQNVYNLYVENVPTEQRWERLYQFMDRAIEAGIIDMSDVFEIENINDVKYAQQIFALKEKKAKIAQQALAQQQMEQNNQTQAQFVQAQTESKIAVEQAKAQSKGQADLAVQQAKNEGAMALEDLKAENQADIEGQKHNQELQKIMLDESQVTEIANKVAQMLIQKTKESE